MDTSIRCCAFIHVDDTGTRHRGQNDLCTPIGNDHFAFFASTNSKSRINFLEPLRAGNKCYLINAKAQATLRAAGVIDGKTTREGS